MMKKFIFVLSVAFSVLFSGCSNTTKPVSLYNELGGKPKIAEIVDNFITEIEFNQEIFAYFEESDVGRFREKLNEHICFLINGPCEYTGDSMVDVHTGMDMSERDFNLGVDLFINAMEKADVAHTTQNKILHILAKTRKEIIYL